LYQCVGWFLRDWRSY